MAEAVPVVFVIDDDTSLREALVSLVRSVGLAVEPFGSAASFLSHRHLDDACCLVLDVRLPDLNGLDLQRALADAGRDIPIIFISGHGDIPMAVRAIKAGAMEFLPKPFCEQDLLDAIFQALHRHYLRRQQTRELTVIGGRYSTLTTRERQVTLGVVGGGRNKQIAANLGISEMTVKVHRRHIMRKMAATSLAQLVRMIERLERIAPAQLGHGDERAAN
jgi:FixJ family two-component response regulator